MGDVSVVGLMIHLLNTALESALVFMMRHEMYILGTICLAIDLVIMMALDTVL